MGAISQENINFDVYNTLNIMNPLLGECYIEEGFNPFGDDYRIDKNHIVRIIQNKEDMEEMEINEEFMTYDNKTVSKHFEKAKDSVSKLKDSIAQETNSMNMYDNKKQMLDESVIYLKSIEKLLSASCDKLKNGKANPISLFKNILGINKGYSKIIRKLFEAELEETMKINFINQCILQNTIKKDFIREFESERTEVKTTEQTQIVNKDKQNTSQAEVDKINEESKRKAMEDVQKTAVSHEETKSQTPAPTPSYKETSMDM